MKRLNDKKICFIFCTNNQQYADECMLYLSLLQVPEGYETEVLAIEDAGSITQGYNEGMRASDAKYKVYLHHDTFITEPQFIQKLLNVFAQDESIGLFGMVGAEKLSKDGVMWHEERCGDFYRLDLINDSDVNIVCLEEGVKEVAVVDGLLIATQYDIPWREDLLKGWDFYDVSQCMEFHRAGYRVVVPAQNPAWVIHACGAPSFWHYEANRKLIMQEYPEIWKDNPRLRILFIHSDSIQLVGLAYALNVMGYSVNIPDYQVSLGGFRQRDVDAVEGLLEEGHYDLVVTYDFSMGVAKACENQEVKYYAWVYDSPLLDLYSDYAKSPYNYISVFDRKQYERMKEFGIPNLYHLPLCAEVEVFGAVNITKRDEKKYAADISFVGRLYDKRGYDKLFDDQSAALKEEFDRIASEGNCHWDNDFSIYNKASKELVEHITNRESEEVWKLYQMGKQFYCESMKLAGRCNELERITVLNKLAERYKVVLYSDDTPKDMLKGVKVKPWVDYWAEMPKVFYLSKINLNITSRTIETGIPQRVWDILAVGGFCLTNYQEELADYFVEGKDLEVYRNIEELLDKAEYYLKHEDKRMRIAMSGYRKVKESHDYYSRLKKMMLHIFPTLPDTWV